MKVRLKPEVKEILSAFGQGLAEVYFEEVPLTPWERRLNTLKNWIFLVIYVPIQAFVFAMVYFAAAVGVAIADGIHQGFMDAQQRRIQRGGE